MMRVPLLHAVQLTRCVPSRPHCLKPRHISWSIAIAAAIAHCGWGTPLCPPKNIRVTY